MAPRREYPALGRHIRQRLWPWIHTDGHYIRVSSSLPAIPRRPKLEYRVPYRRARKRYVAFLSCLCPIRNQLSAD